MKVKTGLLALIILAVLFGGIALSSALGFWRTSGSRGSGTGQGETLAAGVDPAAIKGSTAFSDIAASFDIPLADLAAAFALPDLNLAAGFRCKDLGTYFDGLPAGVDIGPRSVRFFVRLYLGLPTVSADAAWLPGSAADVLDLQASLDPGQRELLEQFTFDNR